MCLDTSFSRFVSVFLFAPGVCGMLVFFNRDPKTGEGLRVWRARNLGEANRRKSTDDVSGGGRGTGGGDLRRILRDTAVRTNKLFSFQETYLPRSPDSVGRGNKLVLWISRVRCRRLIVDVCTLKASGARDRNRNGVASLAAVVYSYRFVIPITRFKRNGRIRVALLSLLNTVSPIIVLTVDKTCVPAAPARVRFNFYARTHNCRDPSESVRETQKTN